MNPHSKETDLYDEVTAWSPPRQDDKSGPPFSLGELAIVKQKTDLYDEIMALIEPWRNDKNKPPFTLGELITMALVIPWTCVTLHHGSPQSSNTIRSKPWRSCGFTHTKTGIKEIWHRMGLSLMTSGVLITTSICQWKSQALKILLILANTGEVQLVGDCPTIAANWKSETLKAVEAEAKAQERKPKRNKASSIDAKQSTRAKKARKTSVA